MINQLRFFLSQSPKPSPVNVYVGDAQFSLTAGELAEAMAVTNVPPTEAMQVSDVGGLRVRVQPGTSANIKGKLTNGSVITVTGSIRASGFTWSQIQEVADPALRYGWVAREYLKPITEPPPPPLERVRKVGWHISIGQTPDLNILKVLHEAGTHIPVILLVNRPDLIAPIKRFSPKTLVVCRNYPDDHPPMDDPQGWTYQQIERMRPCLEAGADYLTLTNEWCAHEDQGLTEAARQADWWSKAIGAAESKGVKITVLDLAAMHLIRPQASPSLWANVWKPVLEKAARLGFPLNYHCYTHPTSIYDARNMAAHAMMRWVGWVAEIPSLKILGGEFGAGKWNDAVTHKTPAFMQMVRDFDKMIAESRLSNCFLGACAFTLGATPDWEAFNFTDSLQEYVRYMRDGG